MKFLLKQLDQSIYWVSTILCCRFCHTSPAEPSAMPGWISYAYSGCRKRTFVTHVGLWSLGLVPLDSCNMASSQLVSCKLWASDKTGRRKQLGSLLGTSNPREASSLLSVIAWDEQTALILSDPKEDFSATVPCPSHHLQLVIYGRASLLLFGPALDPKIKLLPTGAQVQEVRASCLGLHSNCSVTMVSYSISSICKMRIKTVSQCLPHREDRQKIHNYARKEAESGIILESSPHGDANRKHA